MTRAPVWTLIRTNDAPHTSAIATTSLVPGNSADEKWERIRDELDKLLVVEDPSAGLWFLVDTGLMDEFLPELPAMRLEQDPIHQHKDVLAHTIAVVAKTSPRRTVRLSALFHDIGKPRTRAFVDGQVTFHHHEAVGAKMTRKRLRALGYPEDLVGAVMFLSSAASDFMTGQTINVDGGKAMH